MPFEKGNQLASNNKRWRAAIENALNKRNESRKDKLEALDALAEKLLENAEAGDMQALKELGDRLDGKPTQQVVGSGSEGEFITKMIVEFVGTDGS